MDSRCHERAGVSKKSTLGSVVEPQVSPFPEDPRMLYLGIDQHKSQLTVNLRGEDGLEILKRQVSTQWEKVHAFFADLAERARPEGGFLAVLEVCGMKRSHG
jgi:hypothetical protein